jgi:zinc and cadmium transporter
MVWLYTIISVVLVSLISLVGVVTLSLNRRRLKRILLFLVSFAVGALFGDVFIHLLPESFKELGANITTSLFVIFGFLIFFVLEKFIRWRHFCVAEPDKQVQPVVTMNIVGDGVHNLIDGMLIAASYTVNFSLGVATTLAIILHEIPQEIGDFGILVYGGFSVRKALLFNLSASVMAILGAIITLVIGQWFENFILYLIPITAGGFLYIAGPDLIPELQHELKISASAGQFFSILLGVGVMAVLVLLD